MKSKKTSSPLNISLGTGLGVGLIGALALAVRFGWRHPLRKHIPDSISPAVFATRVLNTSSGEVVYHTSGNGSPLLFLHGVFPGASSFEWSKIYPYFAHSHQVIVPDLIGFGESQRPRPAINVEAQVQALAAFFRITSGSPMTIIASGLSSNLALLLAARYPQNIARLLLWMPLLTLQKNFSMGPCHHLSWFPTLARIVYQRQWSTEASIKQWLVRSGFSPLDPFLEEVLSVLTSTAQQYGAEYAFLAQSSARFWRHLSSKMSSMTTPVSLLATQDSERLITEAITSLRSYTSRFSINKVETRSPLAPLSDPQPLVASIEHEMFSQLY
ncbi:MAG: alpha/beta fold hydrolase [Verrucomicrobiae bacterium]|jgi:haloalkane dehalogenase|nr:alpha/beta fold hydrolase [Verrucomicrobiae bacterium]